MRDIKTKNFIDRALKVHKDRFLYERAVYVRCHDKIVITCKEHGDFLQSPSSHLQGNGCKKCTLKASALTTEEFIEKANEVHDFKYDYSKSEYTRNHGKLVITCPVHGDFTQIANGHLSGRGCKKCRAEKMSKLFRRTIEEFIEKANGVHDFKYDYSKSKYTRRHDKLIITCKKHGDFIQTPNGHLAGKGCRKCGVESQSKTNALTTEEFIEKANEVHDFKYDYSKSEYTRSHGKLVITCPVHGDFAQSGNGHLSGSGCPECGRESRSKSRASNTEKFIKKAKGVHGSRYDYSKSKYTRSCNDIIITCREHGDFHQSSNRHLSGAGCRECSITNSYSSLEEFVEKAVGKHGDKFNYDKSVYVSSKKEMIITCKKHGDFKQKPKSHLEGKGCVECSIEGRANKLRGNTEDFVKRSKKIHSGKYSYDKTVYFRSGRKVIITCKKHGDFLQTPNSHLGGKGCNKCALIKISKIEHEWLGKIGVKLDNRNINLRLKNGRLVCVDGFNKKTNTVYEFYGDFFHGNPEIYDAEEYNALLKKTHGEIYKKTMRREKWIIESGYKLITIWELDYKKQRT